MFWPQKLKGRIQIGIRPGKIAPESGSVTPWLRIRKKNLWIQNTGLQTVQLQDGLLTRSAGRRNVKFCIQIRILTLQKIDYKIAKVPKLLLERL
jgi:hypothetical protein